MTCKVFKKISKILNLFSSSFYLDRNNSSIIEDNVVRLPQMIDDHALLHHPGRDEHGVEQAREKQHADIMSGIVEDGEQFDEIKCLPRKVERNTEDFVKEGAYLEEVVEATSFV